MIKTIMTIFKIIGKKSNKKRWIYVISKSLDCLKEKEFFNLIKIAHF